MQAAAENDEEEDHHCAYNAVLGVQEQQCMTEKSPVTGTARDFN